MSIDSHPHQAEPTGVIAQGWKSYEDEVIPLSAGSDQRRDMRFCFYAGALTVFVGLINIIKQGLSDEESGARVDAMGEEIYAHVEPLLAARQAPHTPH